MKKPSKCLLGLCFMVSREGVEPSTRWLRVSCSTNWANGPLTNGIPWDKERIILTFPCWCNKKIDLLIACWALNGELSYWCARRDSNARPLASEANALSSWATGAYQFSSLFSWYARQESNLRHPDSKSDALSSWATGACETSKNGRDGRTAVSPSRIGVSDGAWTRDHQGHNLVLYQLSYAHRDKSVMSE